MALKDMIPLGVSLPHRSPEPVDMAAVRRVAQRAEALGFRDLWVTENTLDHVFCFDPVVVLTYAAAVTTTIRLGASVVVMAVHSPLMLAHQWACLDYVSNGRAILGVGLGREHHYRQFEVPEEGRVIRFREELAVIRSLWSEQKTTFHGRFYNLDNEQMSPKPVQQPMPIWMGVGHPNAVRRAARLGDGWMGSGGSSIAAFSRSVPILREALEKAGRDPATFPTSKRVFMAVDGRAEVARAELHRWFTEVYHNTEGTDASGIHGTPEQVRERLEELVAMGANHLLLNPVSRYGEQLEALAAVAGLS
jgi:probable F420-dependent oxidoreductase